MRSWRTGPVSASRYRPIRKRAPALIDYLAALARRRRHRLMIRLVKGAYWDAEIKQSQLDGLAGYPVYTRKRHTDVTAYLACARRLLDTHRSSRHLQFRDPQCPHHRGESSS